MGRRDVSSEVTVTIDRTAVEAGVMGLVAPVMQRAAGRVRDDAKMIVSMEGRVDTGMMRDAIQAETVVRDGDMLVAKVWSMAPHSKFQHDGTANDGAGYITPRVMRVLRFQPRGSGFVFRPKVRGVRGIRFLTRALERTDVTDFL